MRSIFKWGLTLALLAALAAIAYSIPPATWRAWTGELREVIAGLGDRGPEEGAGEGVSAEEEESGAGDDDDIVVPSRVEKFEGLSAVRMSAEEQRQTGVRVLALTATTYQSETLASGRVLDIQPLVDLRAEFNAARGEQEMARAALAASSRAAERMRVLNREGGNVSARQLQEAVAQAASDNARLAAAERRLEDLRNQAAVQWGPTLVDMALAETSALFDQLVTHQDVLVLVTLRPGEELPDATSFIYVGPTGERTRARKAYLVSPASQTDPAAQGETYFFRTHGSKLRIGMHMDAWIPRPGPAREGVEVPGAAVLWYANKLWVYARHGEELFVRRPLREYEETRDGWFVTDGVTAGEEVVVSGAQMLFSEEFRSAIPSEDEARE
ncbi:MAG: hypothetical protein R3F45_02990 [Gammaproteobacteria bacterium]